MMKTLSAKPVSIFFSLVIALYLTATLQAQTLTARDVYERTINSVVLITIESYDDGEIIGSGFVAEKGVVITNAHLFEHVSCKKVTIKSVGTGETHVLIEKPTTVNGRTYYVIDGIVSYFEKDLASIEVEMVKSKPLFPTTRKVNIADSIYVIGNPNGLEGSISTGIVGGFRNDLIQITAPTSPGSSGSPLLNQYGEVIGVIVGGINDKKAENLNFAIPSIDVLSFLHPRAYPEGSQWISPLAKKISKSPSLDPKKSPAKEYIEKGDTLFSEGNLKKAAEMYELAIKLDEKVDADVYVSLSLCYDFEKDEDKHRRAVRSGLKQYPDNCLLLSGLAWIYIVDRRYVEANNIAKKIVEIDPTCDKCYFTLGYSYLRLGDKASALEMYKILKQMNSHWAQSLFDAIFRK